MPYLYIDAVGVKPVIEQPGIYPGMSALENVILQGYSVGVDNVMGVNINKKAAELVRDSCIFACMLRRNIT